MESRAEQISVGPETETALERSANGWITVLVAREDLNPGDFICSESAFIVFDKDNSPTQRDRAPDSSIRALLRKAFDDASQEQLQTFRALRNFRRQAEAIEVKNEQSIKKKSRRKSTTEGEAWTAWSNSIPIQSHHEDKLAFFSCSYVYRSSSSEKTLLPPLQQYHDRYGLFLNLGIMPHSCAPNTTISLIENETIVLNAARTIKAGEPLTRSWLHSILAPYANRQTQFQSLFVGVNGGCTCSMCLQCEANRMLLSIDDWLRILMDEERRWLRSQRRLFHTTKVLKRIEDFIKLLEHSYAEGYCNISMLMKMYIQAANIVADEQPDKSILFLRTAAGYAIMALGPNNLETLNIVQLLRDRVLDPCAFERLPILRLENTPLKTRMERLCCFGLLDHGKLSAIFARGNDDRDDGGVGSIPLASPSSSSSRKQTQINRQSFAFDDSTDGVDDDVKLTGSLSATGNISSSGNSSIQNLYNIDEYSTSGTATLVEKEGGSGAASSAAKNDTEVEAAISSGRDSTREQRQGQEELGNNDVVSTPLTGRQSQRPPPVVDVIAERRRSLGAGMIPFIPQGMLVYSGAASSAVMVGATVTTGGTSNRDRPKSSRPISSRPATRTSISVSKASFSQLQQPQQVIGTGGEGSSTNIVTGNSFEPDDGGGATIGPTQVVNDERGGSGKAAAATAVAVAVISDRKASTRMRPASALPVGNRARRQSSNAIALAPPFSTATALATATATATASTVTQPQLDSSSSSLQIPPLLSDTATEGDDHNRCKPSAASMTSRLLSDSSSSRPYDTTTTDDELSVASTSIAIVGGALRSGGADDSIKGDKDLPQQQRQRSGRGGRTMATGTEDSHDNMMEYTSGSDARALYYQTHQPGLVYRRNSGDKDKYQDRRERSLKSSSLSSGTAASGGSGISDMTDRDKEVEKGVDYAIDAGRRSGSPELNNINNNPVVARYDSAAWLTRRKESSVLGITPQQMMATSTSTPMLAQLSQHEGIGDGGGGGGGADSPGSSFAGTSLISSTSARQLSVHRIPSLPSLQGANASIATISASASGIVRSPRSPRSPRGVVGVGSPLTGSVATTSFTTLLGLLPQTRSSSHNHSHRHARVDSQDSSDPASDDGSINSSVSTSPRLLAPISVPLGSDRASISGGCGSNSEGNRSSYKLLTPPLSSLREILAAASVSTPPRGSTVERPSRPSSGRVSQKGGGDRGGGGANDASSVNSSGDPRNNNDSSEAPPPTASSGGTLTRTRRKSSVTFADQPSFQALPTTTAQVKHQPSYDPILQAQLALEASSSKWGFFHHTGKGLAAADSNGNITLPPPSSSSSSTAYYNTYNGTTSYGTGGTGGTTTNTTAEQPPVVVIVRRRSVSDDEHSKHLAGAIEAHQANRIRPTTASIYSAIYPVSPFKKGENRSLKYSATSSAVRQRPSSAVNSRSSGYTEDATTGGGEGTGIASSSTSSPSASPSPSTKISLALLGSAQPGTTATNRRPSSARPKSGIASTTTTTTATTSATTARRKSSLSSLGLLAQPQQSSKFLPSISTGSVVSSSNFNT